MVICHAHLVVWVTVLVLHCIFKICIYVLCCIFKLVIYGLLIISVFIVLLLLHTFEDQERITTKYDSAKQVISSHIIISLSSSQMAAAATENGNMAARECGICLELFNEKDQLPKVLKCGHVYCLSCLNDVAVRCEVCSVYCDVLDVITSNY